VVAVKNRFARTVDRAVPRALQVWNQMASALVAVVAGEVPALQEPAATNVKVISCPSCPSGRGVLEVVRARQVPEVAAWMEMKRLAR